MVVINDNDGDVVYVGKSINIKKHNKKVTVNISIEELNTSDQDTSHFILL